MDLLLNVDYVTSAFTSGSVATPRGTVQCFVRRVADLNLATGHVVACDPLVFTEAEPFTVTVPPGTHPVMLAVAQVSETDQRVAFAKLQFAPGDPAAWRMAVVSGQDPSTLAPNHFFGYPVDAGTGSFMDAAASVLLLERMSAEEEYYDTIIDAMEKTSVPTWSYADIRPSQQERENCVVFSSGWGDGMYASYFGYSAAGEVVCLITDFDVLWREDLPPEAEAPKPKPWWKFW